MSKDYQAASKAVYDYYRRVFGKSPQQYKLTPARRKKIITRLKEGYSVADIEKAIRNLRASDWHIENGHIGLDTFLLHRPERLDDWIAKSPKPKHRDPGHSPQTSESTTKQTSQDYQARQAGFDRQIDEHLAKLPPEILENKLQGIETNLRETYPVSRAWTDETMRSTARRIFRDKYAEYLRKGGK